VISTNITFFYSEGLGVGGVGGVDHPAPSVDVSSHRSPLVPFPTQVHRFESGARESDGAAVSLNRRVVVSSIAQEQHAQIDALEELPTALL
jgi:hypothetical protein